MTKKIDMKQENTNSVCVVPAATQDRGGTVVVCVVVSCVRCCYDAKLR